MYQENDDKQVNIYTKTNEEINEMCDSGMFNSIIKGYILLACDITDVKINVHFSELFDFYSAADARKRYENGKN